MKKIINLPLLFLGLVLVTGSCKKALEETPYSFISPEQMEDSPEGLRLWVNGVRTTFLRDGFFRYEIFNRPYEMDSDDITGNRSFYNQVGAGNFANAGDIANYWSSLYLLINRANYVQPFIEKMENVSDEEKNNAIGELNFYKGWAYFTLVRAFGPLPLYKVTAAYGEEKTSLPRSSVPEVYAYIIEVLKVAEQNLYARSNADYKTGDISQEAAKTMLAKVYLTMASGALSGATVEVMGGPHKNQSNNGRLPAVQLSIAKDVVAGHESFNATEYFTLARDKAKEVMDVAATGYVPEGSSAFGLFESFNAIWSKNSRGKGEHLWMLYSEQGQDVSGMVLTYHYYGLRNALGQMVPGSGPMGLSDHWYDLFETKDRRVRDGVVHKFAMQPTPSTANPPKRWYPKKEQDWALASVDSATKFGYDDPSYKWTGGDQGIARVTKFSDVTDPTIRRSDAPYPFLRYAETILIYAEAENEISGPNIKVADAVNQIRDRSDATLIDYNNFDKQTLRSFILEERRRELALEGNRPWDLRRWGIYLQVMNAIGGNDNNNINKNREPRHLLFALPIVEIASNTEIHENNPGW